ncbi:hypothetical protein BDA96_07G078600 [Sorghum bicolor]|uniref:Uncharacterized protein n=2 Tax=Sorghum bicolor TaxID=4558 RepID=A0A921U9T4_SORBI|nr:hypothetical protein BDA96_07G078600 [Sorghum bicolor]KXG24941.1 hypothetical protein SORBI_3007G102900 [Sorghum bicolor]
MHITTRNISFILSFLTQKNQQLTLLQFLFDGTHFYSTLYLFQLHGSMHKLKVISPPPLFLTQQPYPLISFLLQPAATPLFKSLLIAIIFHSLLFHFNDMDTCSCSSYKSPLISSLPHAHSRWAAPLTPPLPPAVAPQRQQPTPPLLLLHADQMHSLPTSPLLLLLYLQWTPQLLHSTSMDVLLFLLPFSLHENAAPVQQQFLFAIAIPARTNGL